MKNIFLLISVLFLVSCTEDVKDVTLSGFIYSKNTNKPLVNAVVEIENWYYDNSVDESYTGNDKYFLITDSKGFYSVKFKMSAYISIEAYKDGYSKVFKDKHTFKRNTKIDFYLLKSVY